MSDDYDAADHRGGRAALQFFICACAVFAIAAAALSIHGSVFPDEASAETIDDQLNRMQSESDRNQHAAAEST
ncbi:MAG: hypothetical protein J4F28_09275, partial [Nitrosopumilaceae archaeon]|nr:hypothetical protein [Nitrosopumilaceae archaeon]